MSISLRKKTGINLSKGSKISLVKDEKVLEQVCVGLNWGAIKKKALFGLVNQTVSVDLDGSVTAFNKEKKAVYTVYFNRLVSNDFAIRHSGDDRSGDSGEEDDLDNEIITLDLPRIQSDIDQIVFYLNSYKGQDFGDIPYAKIRIYEGTKDNIIDVFATFNLSVDASFAGNVSMIMGKMIRTPKSWEFRAIGEPIKAFRINETIKVIKELYLD